MMKIKFTRTPTITKAVIATVVFSIVFLATNSNLPSCSDAVATLNAGECIVRQSYLHTACGWLALVSLATGVVLFILKQRKASSLRQQAPSRPAWSGAPMPAETTVPEERTRGDGIGQVTAKTAPSAATQRPKASQAPLSWRIAVHLGMPGSIRIGNRSAQKPDQCRRARTAGFWMSATSRAVIVRRGVPNGGSVSVPSNLPCHSV
jgi:hypothetical protein